MSFICAFFLVLVNVNSFHCKIAKQFLVFLIFTKPFVGVKHRGLLKSRLHKQGSEFIVERKNRSASELG